MKYSGCNIDGLHSSRQGDSYALIIHCGANLVEELGDFFLRPRVGIGGFLFEIS